MSRKMRKLLSALLAVLIVLNMITWVVIGEDGNSARKRPFIANTNNLTDIEKFGDKIIAPTATSNTYWGVELYFYDSTQEGDDQIWQGSYKQDLTNYESTSDYDAKTRYLSLQVNYWNSDVAEDYDPGTVKLYVKNPFYGLSDGTQFVIQGISVSTALQGSTAAGRWQLVGGADLSTLLSEEYFEFENIVDFGNNSNFQGNIQIVFEILSQSELSLQDDNVSRKIERFENFCEHTTGSMELDAYLEADADPNRTDDDVRVDSSTLEYELYRKYLHPWEDLNYTVNKKGSALSNVNDFIASTGLKEDEFEKYYWVRWDISALTETLSDEYLIGHGWNSNRKWAADVLRFTDVDIPNGARVFSSDGTELFPNGEGELTHEIELPYYKHSVELVYDSKGYSHWYLVIGYPKDKYSPGDEIKNHVDLDATYIDRADTEGWVEQDDADDVYVIPENPDPNDPKPNPPIDPEDPGKDPSEPEPKDPDPDDPDPDDPDPDKPDPDDPTPPPAQKWYDIYKTSTSTDVKYYQGLIGLDDGLNLPFTYKLRIFVPYNTDLPSGTFAPDGKLPYTIEEGYGMDVVIGDDALYISDENGGYRPLGDGEYYFSKINFPATLYNSSGPISTGKYYVDLYVRHAGDNGYKLAERFTNGSKTTFTFEEEDNVAGYYFVIRAMKESLTGDDTLGRYNDFTNTVVITNVKNNNVNIENGYIYNFGFLKVYREEQKNENWGAQGWLNQVYKQNYPNDGEFTEDIAERDKTTTHGGYVQRAESRDPYQTILNIKLQMRLEDDKYMSMDSWDAGKRGWSGESQIGMALVTNHISYYDVDQSLLDKYVYGIPDEYWCAGWELHDLLPEYMELNMTAAEIKNSMAFDSWTYSKGLSGTIYQKAPGATTGTKVTASTLQAYIKNHTTVKIEENYHGTNRTCIHIVIDLSDNLILATSNYTGQGSRAYEDYTTRYIRFSADSSSNKYGQTVYYNDIRFNYTFFYHVEGYMGLPENTNGTRTVYNNLLAGFHERAGYPIKNWDVYREVYWDTYYNDPGTRDSTLATQVANDAASGTGEAFLYHSSVDPGVKPSPGSSSSAYNPDREKNERRTSANSYVETIHDWQDLDDDGDYTNHLARDYATANLVKPDGSYQSVLKEVSAGTTGFNTSNATAKLDGLYQYRLTVQTGNSQLDDIIIYDDIEEWYQTPDGDMGETDGSWYGSFVSVDVSGAVGEYDGIKEIKIYYSTLSLTDALYDETGTYNTQWIEYDESVDPKTVHSLAFQFIKNDSESWGNNYTLAPDSKVSILITMRAPSSNDDPDAFAHNGCWTSWKANDEEGIPIAGMNGINSNTVKVYLPIGVSVEKKWEDNDSPNRPTSVTVELLRDGKVYDNAVLDESNEWKHTWDDLEREHEWTVRETNVPDGYVASSVYDEEEEKWVVTNKLKPIDVTVTKVWDDGKGNNRPENVWMQLYRNGEPYGDPVELNDGNNWTYTWTDLEGIYTWTVDEPDVPDGYKKKSVANEGNAWTITNSKELMLPETGSYGLAVICASAAVLGVTGLTLSHKKKKRVHN